jgi:amidase
VEPDHQRRQLLEAALLAAAAMPLSGRAAGGSKAGDADLARLDAVGTAGAIRDGRFTAEAAVDAAIDRARRVGPAINAIVTEAFDRARAAARHPLVGPLSGVPTFIKDLDDVRGLPTHSGSRSFGHSPATGQGPYVDALERSGLVFLGKSATPEFGLTSTTEPMLSGPCRNPWNTGHSTGGSSGGAAALVAARVVPVAQATDGGGSIRIPASCCGVFGLKPSRGRNVPLGRPVGPVDISVSHAETISVRDSARWLAVTERTGVDQVLPPLGYVERKAPAALRVALDRASLSGAPLDPEVERAVTDTAQLLTSLGHHVEPAALPLDKEKFQNAFVLYWASGAAGIADGLERALGRPVTEADLEPWTLGLRRYFLEHRGNFDAAVATLRESVATCEEFFTRYDVLLTPTISQLPPPIGYLGPDVPFDVYMERAKGIVGFTPVQNASGQPAMSVPLNWSTSGLPIGSHFATRAGGERTLLELAYQLEEARPWAGRIPPVSAA